MEIKKKKKYGNEKKNKIKTMNKKIFLRHFKYNSNNNF